MEGSTEGTFLQAGSRCASRSENCPTATARKASDRKVKPVLRAAHTQGLLEVECIGFTNLRPDQHVRFPSDSMSAILRSRTVDRPDGLATTAPLAQVKAAERLGMFFLMLFMREQACGTIAQRDPRR